MNARSVTCDVTYIYMLERFQAPALTSPLNPSDIGPVDLGNVRHVWPDAP